MVKMVAIASLNPGVDPDEAWAYWRDKHGPWANSRFLPEAKKYVINRVIRRFEKNDGVLGRVLGKDRPAKGQIFGFCEVWFDDMGSLERGMSRLLTNPDEYVTKWITIQERIVVEEEEIKP